MVIHDLNSILEAREMVDEKKETVYFNEILEGIKISVYNTSISKKVKFKCSFDEVDSIFTIRSYMYSVFYNLLSNSIKYRKPDLPLTIAVKSQRINDKIELRFKDNGKGIDLHKNASRLFGLYKRFDTTMEGKGMGLFMVKTQVEAVGGTITVKSRIGKGTEFIIQLPG